MGFLEDLERRIVVLENQVRELLDEKNKHVGRLFFDEDFDRFCVDDEAGTQLSSGFQLEVYGIEKKDDWTPARVEFDHGRNQYIFVINGLPYGIEENLIVRY